MVGVPRTILVVEDDPVLQRAMAKGLEAAKFTVRTAIDYETAVGILKGMRPSLVCVDLALPRESGYDLCEHIRGPLGLERVPILVTSDSGFPEDMACAEQAGANAFLKKPFPPEKLIKYVLALLDGPNSSRPSVRRLRIM